jgi:hypothetical protein
MHARRDRDAMRIVFAALVLLAAFAAGCLENSERCEAGDSACEVIATTTPPAPTSTPSPTSPAIEDGPEASELELREVAAGSQSAHAPARTVIQDATSWEDFWAEHTTTIPAEPLPDVDFEEERVLAVVLEDKPNGCWAVRITRAFSETTENGTEIEATVTTYAPAPGQACTAVVTQPFHAVAIPHGGVVRFTEERVTRTPTV